MLIHAQNRCRHSNQEVIMNQDSTRRDFLKLSMGAACAAPLASLGTAATGSEGGTPDQDPASGRIKKAVQIYMLPKNLN